MTTLAKNARIAGFLYVLASLVGILRLGIIPNRLIVTGNAAATSANIAAHETLFRFGILSDLFGGLIFLFVTFALYRLFKDVDERMATLMVILGGLMVTPIFFLNTLTDAGTLVCVHGADFLASFDKGQRDGLAMLFLRLHMQGIFANEIFWGVWLIPFGVLVYKSGFLPRILGVWLILACVGWLAVSVTGILAPQLEPAVYLAGQPLMIGEIVMILWLVVMGAKQRAVAA